MIRILLLRECRRLWKNPSAVMLVGLLIAISLLVATGGAEPKSEMQCWVVYWQDSDWIEQLKMRRPEREEIHIEPASRFPRTGEHLVYPKNSCAIEIRPSGVDSDAEAASVRITYRYPGKDPNVLMPYLCWFWPASIHYFGDAPPFLQQTLPIGVPLRRAVTPLENLQDSSVADLVTTEIAATALLFVVQFFTCCHLLVSLTSQDRERGTLTALALTPVSIAEILTARCLFHLTISMGASSAVLAILQPSALVQPLLWIVLVLTSLGMMAIGTTIATLSRTQTTAGLLTLSYMLGVGVVFYLSTQFPAFDWVKLGMLERYSLPLVYLNLKLPLSITRAPGLIPLLLLSMTWLTVAALLFRRFGWR
ncbi:MAG: hypothetical protein DWH78_09825 [Planctomycetota bacterium]|nr:MAG: hypothetical protein DWH78_09825 [Planctomycetota bacterium]